jgi:hypothetical protein
MCATLAYDDPLDGMAAAMARLASALKNFQIISIPATTILG